MSGPSRLGSLRHSIELSPWLALAGAISPSASKTRPSSGWEWRFPPTPGNSCTMSYPNLPEMVGGTDAGEESSCGELTAPAETITSASVVALSTLPPLSYSTPVQRFPSKVRRRTYALVWTAQIRSVLSRVQVRNRRALAFAVRYGQLVPARTLLRRTVEVVGQGVAELLSCVEEDLGERVRVGGDLGAHGTAVPR
jgi:hypothetical protein